MAFRIDRGSLRSPKRLDDGRIIGEGVLTRSGVFVYRNPDGSERREYRPPEEVFKQDSMQSFALVPVTDDHPLEMVTADTAKNVSVGTVGEALRQDGSLLIAPLAINDASAVARLDEGKTALSCGYNCDIEDRSGVTPEGERFDSIQRNIRGNHVALVDVARAGPEARIRMDAAIMIGDNRKDQDMDLKEALMKIAELEVAKAAESKRADDAESKLTGETARADAAEAERDSAKEAAEAADKARTDAADSFAADVQARVALEKQAQLILAEEQAAELASKSDREIQCAVIEAVQEFKCDDDKSDVYVQARFDAAIELHAKGTKVYDGLAPAGDTREDSEDLEAAARKRQNERNREIGRKPLNKE